MTANRTASICLALTGALFLAVGGSQAFAQTITKPNKPAAAKSAKPATASGISGSGDYWSANTDLGKYSSGGRDPNEDRRPNPTRDLGRVPLQTGPGSVGFTSQSNKIGQFSDGRTVPGHDRYTQNPSSYVGMSLSVPSDSKSFPLISPSSLFPGGNNGW